MQLSDLPPEMIELVLLAAVRARTLHRALRLRLVSRAWDSLIERAIYESGHLDLYNRLEEGDQYNGIGHKRGEDFGPQIAQDSDTRMAFWRRYLVYRSLHATRHQTPRLAILRRLAERVVSFRRGLDQRPPSGIEEAEEESAAVAECLGQLCGAILTLEGHYRILMPPPLPMPSEPIPEDHTLFRRGLLAAAAATNDVALAQKLLEDDWTLSDDWAKWSKLRRQQNAIFAEEANPWTRHLLGFFYNPGCTFVAAYKIAAMLGRAEIIALFRSLSQTLNRPDTRPYRVRRALQLAVLLYAVPAGQSDVVDVFSGPATADDDTPYGLDIHRFDWPTPSVQLLKRFVDAALYDHLQTLEERAYIQGPVDHERETIVWFTERLGKAAATGNIPLIEYIVQKCGASLDGPDADTGNSFQRPVCAAALRRKEDGVRWLLERGALPDHGLVAAAKGGSVAIVKLMLNYHGASGPGGSSLLSRALVEAVYHEDDEMFHVLVKAGAVMDEDDIWDAGSIVRIHGHQSMGALLWHHVRQKWLRDWSLMFPKHDAACSMLANLRS